MKNELKNYKIYNKDSRELSKFIKKEGVDFIVFSPPYWNLRNYEFENQIGFGQTYKEYLKDMESVFTGCYRVLKNGRFMAINIGTTVSNEGMKFIAGDFVNKCKKVGFVFRKDIIWHKPRGVTKWQRGATQFYKKPYPLMFNTNINHEFILIFQKGKNNSIDFNEVPEFNKTFIKETVYSVWNITPVNSPKKDERHLAPFPEELPRKLIQLFTFKSDTVLDPFAGCGTANKTALELGRKTIAVELSEEYCKLIKLKLELVKFDSYGDEIYDKSKEYEIKKAKEKFKKARNNYIKAEREYKKILKKFKKGPHQLDLSD